jgi:putative FmdB family regulatory protein
MPLYEYQCLNCGEEFEVMQKFSDPPLTQHEKCGGEVHRLLSAPALQFKGSGWYITDYAKGSSSGKPGGEKGSAGDKGTGDKAASENGANSPKSDSNSSSASSNAKTPSNTSSSSSDKK